MKAAAHIPRKRFGQHFLCDEGVIDGICRAIDPQASDRMVEIGPGLGALTNSLLPHLQRLAVIELDRDLAARMRLEPRIHVTEADVLNVDFTQLSQELGGPIRVVGNLPYNISTPIAFHLLDHVGVIVDQHFMLQKEVVDRMVATPGHKAYGRLSVMLQWRYDMTALFDVDPDAFNPPPKVMSAIVRMVPRVLDRESAATEQKVLGELVTVAFSQRRKILRHTLGRWLEDRGHAAAFDAQRRAEEVPVSEYMALARAVCASRPEPT